jgi:hypothetical protein
VIDYPAATMAAGRLSALLLLGAFACACGGPEGKPFSYALDGELRVNHVQAKASHNSYHLEPPGNTVPYWRYSHLPLDEQLDRQGVRGVELDVNLDESGELKVYHFVFADEVSTCPTLVACLERLWSWSARFPGHVPIYVHIELKSNFPDEDPERIFGRVEDDILSVLPRERILTPARVAAGRGALGAAIAQGGWPTLGETRGTFYFVLDDAGAQRAAYTHGGAHLDDRLMFAKSLPGDPFAAVAIINDPIGEADVIRAALAANMLVRTRADSDGVEPEANDRTRLDAALASGAHLVTTDFPGPTTAFGAYYVEIPGGSPVRCQAAAPAACTPLLLEDPAFVGSSP